MFKIKAEVLVKPEIFNKHTRIKVKYLQKMWTACNLLLFIDQSLNLSHVSPVSVFFMVPIPGVAEIEKHFKILVTCFSARVSRSAGI
jgi:hypothetical protein